MCPHFIPNPEQATLFPIQSGIPISPNVPLLLDSNDAPTTNGRSRTAPKGHKKVPLEKITDDSHQALPITRDVAFTSLSR